MSDSAETTQQKMDRRKKRTSTNQYMMYIEMMEKDPVFATGRIPREYDSNYLTRKWKELSDKLNNCSNGPTLTSEEWRKRLNDWKNTTRCKYRRSISGEKDITMTSLELRALELFGKVPATAPPEQISIHFKSEKDDEDEEMEHMPTTETFQKQLQAAVEEAIGDDDGEHMVETEHDDHEEIIPENTHSSTMNHGGSGGGGGGGSNNGNSVSGGTTYRTIVVEDSAYAEDEQQDEQLEFITHRRSTVGSSNTGSAIQTAVVTTTPSAAVAKLINGDIPLKRLRSQISEQIIYEVKKAPHGSRTYTVTHPHIQQHQTQTHQQQQHQQHHQQHQQQNISQEIPTTSSTTLGGQLLASQDVREVARQLKRIADIKAEKLKFDIARFKFNNPGFSYNFNPS